MQSYDVLIRKGRIVDGSGAPWYLGTVAIEGDRLHVLPVQTDGLSASVVIEAEGLVVAPGFIDVHSHSDLLFALPLPTKAAKVVQGVTTDVIGLDGLSYAPLSRDNAETMGLHLAGINGPMPQDLACATVREFLSHFRDAVPNNVAYLVPHAALRVEAMGWKDRPPTRKEMLRMEQLLDQAIADGAFGLSTALTYAPCSYAGPDELVRLCKVVARRGGLFAPHTRSTLGDHFLEPLREAIAIARQSGVKLGVSHLNCFGPGQRGRSSELLALIDEARSEGLDVTFDSHPYPVANIVPSLTVPQDLYRDEGPQGFLRRLQSEEAIAEIERQMTETAARDSYTGVDWGKTYVNICGSGCEETFDEGCTIRDIAARSGRGSFETVCSLMLRTNLALNLVKFGGCPEDVRRIAQHPAHMFCSDGLLVGHRPHPRGYGTYPRILRELCRQRGLLSIEEAVMKMSYHPARRLGLRDRGLVRSGMKADLVVFDPGAVRDHATYSHPKEPPSGIEYVFVNGRLVAERGRYTGAMAGRTLLNDD